MLVVRAEYGEVKESRVVEGDFERVVRDVVSRALEEWNPAKSDFIVLRDERVVEVESLDQALAESLRSAGALRELERGLSVRVPVVTVSFDNEMVSEERYEEHKIYIVTLYVSDDFKTEIEAEAAEITSAPEEPEGIQRVG
ncbi:MAG: DUF2286 domain-containing protein [Acidilobaceae archaeon]